MTDTRLFYDLGAGYRFERAEKALFAVYQALYSQADVEQWYDWERRLGDTLWTEACYFLTQNGQKLGGAIFDKGRFCYPFLVSPFADRALFYRLLHKALLQSKPLDSCELVANDVVDAEVEVLLTMGYTRTRRSRRVMIRPTDTLDAALPAGFCREIPLVEQAEEITAMLNQAFENTLDAEVLGPMTVADTRDTLERALKTGTLEVSSLVYQVQNRQLVGVCLAGVDPNAANGFAGLSVVAVLKAFQNLGLGAFMVKTALTQAHPHASAMKLAVTSGNPSENLYLRLGFLPGPRFTQMKAQV